MQEILTVATYLVAWLICKWGIGIESGFITLIVSLGAAIVVYVVIGIKEHEEKKRNRDEE